MVVGRRRRVPSRPDDRDRQTNLTNWRERSAPTSFILLGLNFSSLRPFYYRYYYYYYIRFQLGNVGVFALGLLLLLLLPLRDSFGWRDCTCFCAKPSAPKCWKTRGQPFCSKATVAQRFFRASLLRNCAIAHQQQQQFRENSAEVAPRAARESWTHFGLGAQVGQAKLASDQKASMAPELICACWSARMPPSSCSVVLGLVVCLEPEPGVSAPSRQSRSISSSLKSRVVLGRLDAVKV